jgi:hypothetical protein
MSVVIVPRDYSSGTVTKFEEQMPAQLAEYGVSLHARCASSHACGADVCLCASEKQVPNEVFEATITRINEFFEEAEQVNMVTFMEGCMGCMSFFLLYLCYDGHYGRVMKKFGKFLREENETYKQFGVQWTNPISNGLLHVCLLLLGARTIMHAVHVADEQRLKLLKTQNRLTRSKCEHAHSAHSTRDTRICNCAANEN